MLRMLTKFSECSQNAQSFYRPGRFLETETVETVEIFLEVTNNIKELL